MKRIINKFNNFRSRLYSPESSGIKSIELLLGLCSLTFSLTILSQGTDLLNQYPYIHFKYIGSYWIWLGMLLISIMQLKNLNKKGVDAEVTSSLLLKVSSLIYFMIGVLFIFSYPPLHTSVGISFVLSFFSMITAFEIDNRYVQKMMFIKETINE